MEVFGGSPDDNNAYFNGGAMDTLKPQGSKVGALVIKSGQTAYEQIAIQGWKAPKVHKREMDNLLTAYYADEPVDVVLSPNDSLAQGIVALS